MAEFKFANWEKRYQYEKDHDLLVEVDNDITIDKRSIQSVDRGIYTKELGRLPDSDKDVREFSCSCGALYGRFYEGEVCSECETEVKEQYGTDIRRVGWVNVSPYIIINPNAYEMIARIIGNKRFQSIIQYDIDLDIDGFSTTTSPTKKQMTPYANIGIVGFQKKFEEIITHFATLKGLTKEAELLITNKESVFSSKIPVTTIYLRPTFTSSKRRNVNYDKINAIYIEIISNTNILRKSISNRNKTSAYSTLYTIQLALQKLYDSVIRTKLSGKTKLIRAQVLGTRMSFSSRMVIRSNVGRYSGLDHVVISYKGFLELYLLEILNCMKNGCLDDTFTHMTIYEIYEYITRVRYSSKRDDKIYAIMQKILEERGDTLRVLINRNPTLDLGSIQCMKIVHINPDPKDYTLAIPLTSLKPMSGDFDGDVLNVYSLKEKSVMEAFNKGFNPRFLLIDRTGDKYYNSDFGLIKDQLTNLIEFTRPLSDM